MKKQLNSLVDSTRILQTVEDMESDVVVCLLGFVVQGYQTELTRSIKMECDRKLNALLGDEGFWLLLTW